MWPSSDSRRSSSGPEPRRNMLLKEYRIPLPLSVDEYRVAQLYMIAVSGPRASPRPPRRHLAVPLLASERLRGDGRLAGRDRALGPSRRGRVRLLRCGYRAVPACAKAELSDAGTCAIGTGGGSPPCAHIRALLRPTERSPPSTFAYLHAR